MPSDCSNAGYHAFDSHGTGIASCQRRMVPTRALRRSLGFTLVELLVVMAIFAAMALVAIPWFFKITQRNALKSSAHQVQITLAAARMSAVKRNAPVSVVINSLTPPIQFAVIMPNPPAPTPTLVPQYLSLPQDAVRFVETPVGGVITFGGDGRMTAPVLGSLTPAVIKVEGPANSSPRNSISINTSSNGRIQFVTPVDWQ